VILEIGAVGHGGICIAHAPDGRAVFVRHALPGERVRVEVTEERPSYLRADAVEILEPAADRVTPPCPWAGPGRCGGCDWQHVALDAQRRMKAAVITDQLQRIAGIERSIHVSAVRGDERGLHWRTRMRLAVDDDGIAGLHRHRSHEVERIDDCLIAHPDLPVASVVSQKWPEHDGVELTRTDVETAAGRSWQVPEGGFWQVHPGAADALAEAVIELGEFRPADGCLDLYSGVGLFAGVIAPRVARVVAVESSAPAVAAARSNLSDLANVTLVRDRVDRWLGRERPVADVVVLDPPRKGAGRRVIDGIAAAGPRRVIHVACDPASLARDIGLLARHGYRLGGLRAFDLFPMTAHVECVAQLDREAA
jgi:tRNA/tmRNA/rRNA uracil-C5-methylase (TrmA/RlmC/RlmD family)